MPYQPKEVMALLWDRNDRLIEKRVIPLPAPRCLIVPVYPPAPSFMSGEIFDPMKATEKPSDRIFWRSNETIVIKKEAVKCGAGVDYLEGDPA